MGNDEEAMLLDIFQSTNEIAQYEIADAMRK